MLAAALNLGAWWYSDKIALKFSGAHEVDESAQPELHRMVAQLAENADIPKPRVYVMDTPMQCLCHRARSAARGRGGDDRFDADA